LNNSELSSTRVLNRIISPSEYLQGGEKPRLVSCRALIDALHVLTSRGAGPKHKSSPGVCGRSRQGQCSKRDSRCWEVRLKDVQVLEARGNARISKCGSGHVSLTKSLSQQARLLQLCSSFLTRPGRLFRAPPAGPPSPASPPGGPRGQRCRGPETSWARRGTAAQHRAEKRWQRCSKLRGRDLRGVRWPRKP
jgi:hypothetical protein